MSVSPFRLPFFTFLLALFALAGAVSPPSASAQATKPASAPVPQSQQEENLGGQEVELVKPVVWSLREEYYNLRGDAWNNVLIVRADRVVLRGSRLTSRRGTIFRLEVPLTINDNSQSTKAGLGDIYLQGVLVPYFGREFAFAAGSGLTLPTATDARLGRGKWIASPIAGPTWFFGRRGFLVWKLQDYISFAGNGKRPDVHYFSVYPIFVWRFHRRWWTQIEAESTTDFENSNHTGFKTGVGLGRMLSRWRAVWVKPEIGWGPYRPFDFTIKVSVLSVK